MNTTTFSVRVGSSTKNRLEKLAKSTGRSRAFLAAEAISAYLDTNEWQISGIARKARLMKRRWVSVGECFVREGKRYVADVKRDASPKFDRKSPSSRSKKTNGVKRKTVRRRMIFKSDDWYEKAALSMAISAIMATSAD